MLRSKRSEGFASIKTIVFVFAKHTLLFEKNMKFSGKMIKIDSFLRENEKVHFCLRYVFDASSIRRRYVVDKSSIDSILLILSLIRR